MQAIPMEFTARAFEPAAIPAESAMGMESADAKAQRLSAGVARGQEAAFQELYDGYRQRLFRFVLVLGRGDEGLAHEVVQLTMLSAARKLKAVNTEAHLWNWLARVARQHLGKVWRERKKESAVLAEAEADAAAQIEPDRILEESLESAMSGLEAEERRLVEFFYFEGLSAKAIAERLGSTAKAVSSRLERLRGKLRSVILRRLSDET
jgi:RNA polymerase sigma-70 factor (ECF subfamily)